MGKEASPQYKLIKSPNLHKMIVRKEVQSVRPHVVCAILRNIHFTEDIYNSFIDLQDKLHQNIGRFTFISEMTTYPLFCIEEEP